MEHNTTIRTQLEEHIRRERQTLQSFADASGVNRGTLSGIINGNPPRLISPGQLDLITAGMGLPEGALYEMYADECFRETAAHWRRLRPFLLRCAQLKKLICINKVLDRLADNLSHIPDIFDTAEIMYEENWHEAALLLYERVIESEKYSHSERLAISHLRLFQIHEKDERRNLEAALRFHSYRWRLPEALSLDGLHMLAEFFAVKKQWDKVEFYADELRELTDGLCRTRQRDWDTDSYTLRRPLVFYYGKSRLLKASAYEFTGKYEESKRFIAEYAELGWFRDLDETGQHYVELFRLFAKANTMCVDVKMGSKRAVAPYVELLLEQPEEILEGVNTLLESANKYGYFIDAELGLFADQLNYYSTTDPGQWENQYKEEFNVDRLATYYRHLAVYYFRKERFEEGIKKILDSFHLSVQMSQQDNIIKCMTLFEQYRNYATVRLQYLYAYICGKVVSDEVQENSHHAVSPGVYG
ncbi:DNA-binding protein [Paenibacillus sp. P96]|uniref:DNA-binding protein n=1 Tax=Paenibacillus zeirhizosphaerae TaxID=2987519 RepID=A0ABT9FTH6_9BACL|nr:DNA-binding protein [Paenibacillus sp. P96]MDP4098043.1 DNA-binding protein [Paenibacillus sp. P96]